MSKTLVEEEPFAAAVSCHAITEVCAFCFKFNSELEPCDDCNSTYYCSATCRQSDRDDHAVECRLVDKHYALHCLQEHDNDDECDMSMTSFMPELNVRLVLRIYQKWKVRRDLGRTFNGRTIEDVSTHLDDCRKSLHFRKYFKEMYDELRQFTDSARACPAPDVAEQIFAMLYTSCRTIENYDLATAGAGLYVGLSAHPVACAPNAFIISNGRTAQLRTPNKSLVYSPKLTVDSRLYPLPECRFPWQYDLSFIECGCSDCLADQPLRMSARCSDAQCEGVCPLTLASGGQQSRRLTCNRCRRSCNYTFAQVLEANQRAQLFLEATEQLDDPDDWVRRSLMTNACLRPILSDLNVRLAKMSLHLFASMFAMPDSLPEMAVELTERMLACFRRLLPRGHPLRALVVYAVPYAKMRLCRCPSCMTRMQKQVLAQFKEARTEAQLAFGLDHPFYVNGVRLKKWPAPPQDDFEEPDDDDDEDEDDDESFDK